MSSSAVKQWFFILYTFYTDLTMYSSENVKTGLMLGKWTYRCEPIWCMQYMLVGYEWLCNGYESISFGFQLFKAKTILLCFYYYIVKM